jgi:hypothetical protein
MGMIYKVIQMVVASDCVTEASGSALRYASEAVYTVVTEGGLCI